MKMKRRFPMAQWAPVMGFALSVGLVIGCGKNSGGRDAMAAAPSPAHPAMREPPAVSGGMGARGALPQGHPPVDGRSSMAAHPPVGDAPSASGGAGAVDGSEIMAQLARFGISCAFPEGWTFERGSSMRLATVRLPRAEGDAADGEMSIIPARGSVDANVHRWEGQFQEKPTAEVSTQNIGGGLEVTVVEIDGTFTSGGPMMGGGAAAPNTKLLGAIVQNTSGGEMVFFKAWGPNATMEKWRSAFEGFVKSIRPSN